MTTITIVLITFYLMIGFGTACGCLVIGSDALKSSYSSSSKLVGILIFCCVVTLIWPVTWVAAITIGTIGSKR